MVAVPASVVTTTSLGPAATAGVSGWIFVAESTVKAVLTTPLNVTPVAPSRAAPVIERCSYRSKITV